MFWIFLILSLVINVVCVWYIRELLVRFRYLDDNFSSIYDILENYHGHLQSVYELEMFYGEPTLEGLLQHTSDLKEEIEDYKQVFSALGDSEPIEENDE
tara:strand:- start:118 stop:414 length:297 start_codon:yes stop_codon:yes gene_type:complete